jgi:hypothetical protein
MACIQCYQSREEGANYCRTCGASFVTGENPKQTANLLLLLIGAEIIVSVAWLVFQKLIIPAFFKQDGMTDWARVGPFYKLAGWATDVLLFAVTLICCVLIKNSKVRLVLAIMLLLRIVSTAAYRVFTEI